MKKEKHPVSGLTETELIQVAKHVLRTRAWKRKSRWFHIKKNRFPYKGNRYKFGVKCELCDKIMGQSEKVKYRTKSGRYRRKLAWNVDHVCETGLPTVKDLENDLGKYYRALMETPLRILCVDCHAKVTAKQVKKKFKST